MNKKLLICFLKDQKAYTYTYFIGNFIIGLFYYMAYKKIEIIYPLSISLFVYFILMLYKYYEYYKFYTGLDKMIQYHDYQGEFNYEIDKRVNNYICNLHKEYLEKLSNAAIEKEKERRFLSSWIHNMKTPITVTDLLLQRIDNHDINYIDGLREIQKENKKLLQNLDTILNMIRLQDFAKDYIPEQIDLINELNDIINKNKNLFIYNRIFPKIIMKCKEAYILSDRKWNELMLNQIISNGVKYSTEEGTSKNIYFIIENLKNHVQLTIKDEGIGIPEYDIKKVFEPFFTGDNGRKGYHSSGIGLYFCKEVSKMLGHSLNILSEVSKGTSVIITYLSKM